MDAWESSGPLGTGRTWKPLVLWWEENSSKDKAWHDSFTGFGGLILQLLKRGVGESQGTEKVSLDCHHGTERDEQKGYW